MESDMMYTKNILELMNPIIMMESPQLYQALQEYVMLPLSLIISYSSINIPYSCLSKHSTLLEWLILEFLYLLADLMSVMYLLSVG